MGFLKDINTLKSIIGTVKGISLGGDRGGLLEAIQHPD